MQPFKLGGFIFDIDGTLLDTMGTWDRLGEIILERRGIKPRDHLYRDTFHLDLEDVILYLCREYALVEDSQSLMEEAEQLLTDLYSKPPLKPGARDLLEDLHRRDIPMVVASSTDRRFLEPGLAYHGLDRFFQKILTTPEVGKGKSEPKIFEVAMEEMNTVPEETWLIEDGLYSIETGNEMNLVTVGVEDESGRQDVSQLRKTAKIFVHDLESLRGMIENLETSSE